eukprot:12728225-Heterocapsa_arctica.AAC.1
MENLQEPDLLQMRHHRQGRDGIGDSQRKRTNHHVYRHAEGRFDLGRPDCEAKYCETMTIPAEQQDREIDVAEIRCDQIDDRRSEGSHNGRAASGITRHGVAKNEDRQEFQNQC